MKAVTVHALGPFETARVEERPEPVPGPAEVLVDVYASDVNFPDILLMEGRYQRKPALPFVPGMAGAGEVVAVGSEVAGIRPGRRVLVLGDRGSFAERLAAPAEHCLPIGDSLPFDTAAALGLVFQTAWFALNERGGFRARDRVLVLGASGGVGMAAVQLARALGAGRVIAATRGPDGANFARGLGADAVVDASMENLRDGLPAAVRAETEGHGVDIVVDPVGGSVSTAALRALAWQGRHVIVGFASNDIPSINPGYLLVKQIAVLGLQYTDFRDRQPRKVRAAQVEIERLWSEGWLSPQITRRLPLHRFAEALSSLKSGTARGKSILAPKEEG